MGLEYLQDGRSKEFIRGKDEKVVKQYYEKAPNYKVKMILKVQKKIENTPEAYLELNQTSQSELLAKIVNS